MKPLVSVVTLVLACAACGSASSDDDELVVFAAASLTEAFTDLAASFEAAHPDLEVTVNTAGSSDLAAQIVEGAPADVFAAADHTTMAWAADAGALAGDPSVFARNRSAILVAPGNPLSIASVDDLADPDLIVVVCAPEVPCGGYAAEVFSNAGVDVTPDSYESNVRSVVSKVTLGEADAGIVYATDVLAAGSDAAGVEIPDDINVVAEYPIAVVDDAPHPESARAFVDHVLGDEGQAVLATYGFTSP